ncbi:MAG TPA: UDP-glucose/GDP-mannose dehydrogenase family protein [Actinomycetota bacterium]|nr:UDP-glucose/GDP-mannose dehydrogenase family protein [Actinomycetota bacterium]
MRVAVMGAGRVGVPTAASLAYLGHEVTVVDVDVHKVERLAAGTLPFHERGLEELARDVMAQGRLRFTSDPAAAVGGARVAMICVGTPPGPDGAADLSAVDAAAEAVGRHAAGPLIVVIKSTVPPGTAERVGAILRRTASDGAFSVVSNPEFLREGKAVEDSLAPMRILVGTDSADGVAALRELYAPLVHDGVPLLETDPRTAEVAKYACNAFLALKVSYVNALARVCEAVGADVEMVTRAMAADDRIGSRYLSAGLGYGGYCLPKDVEAFARAAADAGYDFGLLHEVQRANREAVDAAFARVLEVLGDPAGARVALLGLSFKPGTDNVTASPALSLARRLLDAGARVSGYDPQAGGNAKSELPGLEVTGDPYAALEDARCAVLCTDWEEFLALDLDRAREAMAAPAMVDARNALNGEDLLRAGFRYIPTGRPAPS